MIFLFYSMVLALNSIQPVMSQEGNFAQFGVNAGDYRITSSNPKGKNSRYIKWKLPMAIPAFRKRGNEYIFVTLYCAIRKVTIINPTQCFNPN